MLKWGVAGLSDGLRAIGEGVVMFYGYTMGLVIFVFWFVVLLVGVEVFGVGGGDREGGGGVLVEAVWTILPMLVLVFIAYPSLVLLYVREFDVEAQHRVGVVGHQWYWEYIVGGGVLDAYMDTNGEIRGLDVDNRLVVSSVGVVGAVVTSADVIHSWAVPGLGVKIDCIPGRLNRILFEVLTPGVYYGQCSELCGIMHSFIPIAVEVLS